MIEKIKMWANWLGMFPLHELIENPIMCFKYRHQTEAIWVYKGYKTYVLLDGQKITQSVDHFLPLGDIDIENKDGYRDCDRVIYYPFHAMKCISFTTTHRKRVLCYSGYSRQYFSQYDILLENEEEEYTEEIMTRRVDSWLR